MNTKNKKIKLYSREEALKLLYPDKKEREDFLKEVEKEKQKMLKEYFSDIGKKIKKGRQAAGLTQEELARKLRTKRSAISRIESGKQNMSIEYIVKILRAIGRPYSIDIRIF